MKFLKNRQKRLERVLAVFVVVVAVGLIWLLMWPREAVKAVNEGVCEDACCCMPKRTYCGDYEDYSK